MVPFISNGYQTLPAATRYMNATGLRKAVQKLY